eukprot:10506309-Ditylum_brightwellii.AAC.1
MCEVVGNFIQESQTWAIHELGRLICHFCKRIGLNTAILLKIIDLRSNCVENYGCKRYAGNMTMTTSGKYNG